MLREALGYPRSGAAPWRTLAVGMVLSAAGVFVLPGIVLAGYFGRVLARSAAGEEAPPRLVGWASLAGHGLLSALATGLYALAGLAAVVALGWAGWLAAMSGEPGFVVAGALLLVVALVGLVGGGLLLFWFYVPAALARYAVEGRLRAAFEVRRIASVTTDGAYLSRWGPGFVLLLAGWVVYRGLVNPTLSLVLADPSGPALVPLLAGHAVGAGVNFYCHVAAFHAFGRAYGAATGMTAPAEGSSSSDEDAPIEDRAPEPGSAGATPTVAGSANHEWGAEAARWRRERRRERDRARAERRPDVGRDDDPVSGR